MTRDFSTRSGLAAAFLFGMLATGNVWGSEEPGTKPQEPKVQPPKIQEPKSESKKEESKKEEKKEEQKAQMPAQTPAPTPPPPPKNQDTKPSDPAARPAEPKVDPKKEDPKASAQPQPSPSPKAQETKPQETAAPTPPQAPKLIVPPILTVKLALMADPRLFPYDINVEVSGEVAELSGKVSSDGEKAAATEIVQSLEGIKSVTNNIEVVKDLNRTMSKKKDEIITQYVKDRFGKSKTLDSAHFDVKSEDGVISLSGKTKFLVIVLEAAEAARQIPGVKAVRTEGIRLEGAD